MRSSHAILVLVGWVLLGSQGCGGGEFASQAASGGEFGEEDGGTSGVSLVGGAGAAVGGASLGGSAGALAGGSPAASGGTESGGAEPASGGHPSGGAPSASGGTETGGAEPASGGHPSGGAPSGGVSVVAGGSSTGGAPLGSGGLTIGGAPSGGAPSGGMVTGGAPVVAGGTSTGGRSSGGVTSGGTATGGAIPRTGGTGGVGGSVGTGGSGGVPCITGLTPCNGTCVNLMNDIRNCGKCNTVCPGPNPFCDNGTCGSPPCSGSACTVAESCCGNACCTNAQLCCSVPGPVEGPPQCVTPVNGTCPVGCPTCVCASPDTSIATPEGPRAIASLREGELVYSVDRGRVVAVPVLRTRRIAVTNHHVVVRATLTNGSVLEISAPHPTADGRRFGELRAGDQLGSLGVVEVAIVPYGHAFTYDILPASDSGTYFAEGALVGSTLAGPANLAISVGAP